MRRHHPFEVRPELSQHFFRDPALARRVVYALPIATRIVIDVGAGTGLLSEALADRGFRVIAIEKDARLFRALRARFIGRTNIECHHGDALTASLPRERYSVVSNVPFGISAALVRRLIGESRPPDDAFLILQLEAAQKFAGTPHETQFSLITKPSFELAIMRRFRRIDFDPPPRVRTALLHVHRREHPLLDAPARARYARFVADVFGASPQAGRALRTRLTRGQVRRLARDLGFAAGGSVRGLTFPQWLAIFRFYENVCLGRDPAVRAVVAHTQDVPTMPLRWRPNPASRRTG
jgi:23S rRNA (adenine-N6)-dimethyltransferase